MLKKKIIFITGLLVVIIIGVYFAWRKINIQKATNNSQQTIASIQNSTSNEQQSATSEQGVASDSQQAIENNQQTATSSQQPVTSEKESAAIVDQRITATEVKSSDSGKIVQKLVSWGFQKSSGRKIDTIILHSSYDALGNDPFSVSGVIAEYKQAQVSPHYLIARDGTIYQLVADQSIAWHAGVAKMPDGRTDVNSFSIGVEMINTQDGKFADAQYDALNRLIGDLKKKYPIKNILGHSDIAPGRKTDPWGIEWKKVDR